MLAIVARLAFFGVGLSRENGHTPGAERLCASRDYVRGIDV
jgi:hypothetical protein